MIKLLKNINYETWTASSTWIQLSLQFPSTDHNLHPSHLQSYAPPLSKSELGQLPIWLCSHHCSSPTFPFSLQSSPPVETTVRCWNRHQSIGISRYLTMKRARVELRRPRYPRDRWVWSQGSHCTQWNALTGECAPCQRVFLEMCFFHLVEQIAPPLGGQGRARRWWSWGRRRGRGVMERLLVIDDSSDSITLSWLAKVNALAFLCDIKWLQGGQKNQ